MTAAERRCERENDGIFPAMLGDWMTTKEIADRYKITPRRVRALIAARGVEARQIGMVLFIRRSDVAKLKPGPAGRPPAK